MNAIEFIAQKDEYGEGWSDGSDTLAAALEEYAAIKVEEAVARINSDLEENVQ